MTEIYKERNNTRNVEIDVAGGKSGGKFGCNVDQ